MLAEFATSVNSYGVVTLNLTPEQTAALPDYGVWDAQITYADGTIRTYISGGVSVQKEVTRV